MPDKCIFVILSYNSEAFLENCLRSVLALKCVDPVIYIADNGSKDGSVDIIGRFVSENEGCISPEFNEENLGTTVPRNRLIRRGLAENKDAKYICVLDSDTVINDHAVSLLLDAVRSSSDIFIAAPRMTDASGSEMMSVKKFPTFVNKLLKACPVKSLEEKGRAAEAYDFFPASDDADKIYDVDYAISACWFMRTDVTDTCGLLDEKIFYAPEDVDYCATVREKGGRVVLVSGAMISHLTQRISKKRLISRMNILHIKGLLYYGRKHRGLNR